MSCLDRVEAMVDDRDGPDRGLGFLPADAGFEELHAAR
jgi:hypothetical protein